MIEICNLRSSSGTESTPKQGVSECGEEATEPVAFIQS